MCNCRRPLDEGPSTSFLIGKIEQSGDRSAARPLRRSPGTGGTRGRSLPTSGLVATRLELAFCLRYMVVVGERRTPTRRPQKRHLATVEVSETINVRDRWILGRFFKRLATSDE